VGNFYQRKFLWTLTPTPIDLGSSQILGNRTLNGDFRLVDLIAWTDVVPPDPFITGSTMGAFNAQDIINLMNTFDMARVSKCRIFWEVTGSRTDARYNLGVPFIGGVNASTYMNNGHNCISYKRDAQQQPFFNKPPTAVGSPYAGNFLIGEDSFSAVNNKGVKQHSVWSGSRTFIPNTLREENSLMQVSAGNIPVPPPNGLADGADFQRFSEYYPVYKKWFKTIAPQTYQGVLNNGDFLNVPYLGVNLNFPQIQREVTYTAAGNLPGTANLGGDYFLTVRLETTIQFKGPNTSAHARPYPGLNPPGARSTTAAPDNHVTTAAPEKEKEQPTFLSSAAAAAAIPTIAKVLTSKYIRGMENKAM